MESKHQFSFEISLSVLNHLGRSLYRNFVTVLGEAISNSWDADAENVWIYVDKENASFVIKDDGIGMSEGDFQDKFLKIGYSKRTGGKTKSDKNRPYIGRKGIGKLALLSCASKIGVVSKVEGQAYVGGVIDNSELDRAIKRDLAPDKYKLAQVDDTVFTQYKQGHKHGTIIYFDKFSDGIKNSPERLKKMLALYFKFSLLDPSFNIFLNDEEIVPDYLGDLADNTEFVWVINEFNDPYLKTLNKIKEDSPLSPNGASIRGFIASVEKPSHLNVLGLGEKTGIDIFVNGRLREVNILRRMSGFSTRHIASYLYGQIHFDELDDDKDRFTTNREGIKPDDDKYAEFLETLEKDILNELSERWDTLRRQYKQPSDPEDNTKETRARDLFNVMSKDFVSPDNQPLIDTWVEELREDAQYNLTSYVDCFISENLIRNYLKEKNISPVEYQKDIDDLKKSEKNRKNKNNVSIAIRKNSNDLSYLSMGQLTILADKDKSGKSASLRRTEVEYRLIRNAVAHTALLTEEAKTKLTSVYDNIKARIKELFK